MMNLLIADHNLLYAKSFMNQMHHHPSDLRICNIATDSQELWHILNTQPTTPDLILLDMQISGGYDIQVLQKLTKATQERYHKSFLILSSGPICKQSYREVEHLIYKVLSQKDELSVILQEIENMMQYKKSRNYPKFIQQKIIDEMTNLSYNTSLKGTRYLIDAICYAMIHHLTDIDNLNKEIYPLLAQKYNQSPHNIKCNISRATADMYCNCNASTLMHYFSFAEEEKPNIKTIIFTIMRKIEKSLDD